MQEGGDPSETNNDPFASLNRAIEERNAKDFNDNYNKYVERLSAFSREPEGVNIFEVASALGKGLLQTPNTGVGSAFQGLSAGFDNVSNKIQERKAQYEKEKREVAMMAAQMAIEDERKADEFLNEAWLKAIGDTNKAIKVITLRYKPEGSEEFVERSYSDRDPQLLEILKNPTKYEASEVKTPLMGGPSKYEKLDDLTAKAILDQEQVWQEEANSQFAVLDKLETAKVLAADLPPEAFGTAALFTLPIKNFFTGIGFANFIDQDQLGTQIAINSVGTGLAMGLISQTKGAISNREMEMFLAASATLGNTKDGFLKIIDLTERIANKAVGYQEAWQREKLRLMDEGKTISEIRSAQTSFQKKYHAENPLFAGSKTEDGGDLYNPELTIEQNLERFEEGTEAYEIMSSITEQGLENYKKVSALHRKAGIQNLVAKQKDVAKGISGVPDGSKFLQTINGVDYYLIPGGSVQNKADIVRATNE